MLHACSNSCSCSQRYAQTCCLNACLAMLSVSVIISKTNFLLCIKARVLDRSRETKPLNRDLKENIEVSFVRYCQHVNASQALSMSSRVEFLLKQALSNISSLVKSRRCTRSSLKCGHDHKCSHVSFSLPQRMQFQSSLYRSGRRLDCRLCKRGSSPIKSLALNVMYDNFLRSEERRVGKECRS